MPRKNVHTTFNSADKNWRNISEGSQRAINVFQTKQEAQTAGKQIAKDRGVEHLVHRRDSKISERNSYGNDPRKSRG
jgi:hypothetical protein